MQNRCEMPNRHARRTAAQLPHRDIRRVAAPPMNRPRQIRLSRQEPNRRTVRTHERLTEQHVTAP